MPVDTDRLREELVSQIRVTDPRVADAMRSVPRHLFLPGVSPEEAYLNEAIVTKRNEDGVPISSSSQPGLMALMLEQLNLSPGDRVLEIGAGTGYNAALMRHIVGPSGTVVSVDIDQDTAEQARAHLAAAGFTDVTVVCADGAGGWAELAPYDRMIATVGVNDLAPAWLDQVTADALIVVPLEVQGGQLSIAFRRADGNGHLASRSIVLCGFMRMRGTAAGPERVVPLLPWLRALLPEGHTVDGSALVAALDGPGVSETTDIVAERPATFWGLRLWLASHESRFCELTEEVSPERPALLAASPVSGRAFNSTFGLADAGGVALIFRPSEDAGLVATGYGQDAAGLAAALAGYARAWDAAGRSGAGDLHIDAYPRATGTLAGGEATLVVERPWTRFAVYHA
jgi:protein-L-isoaspartate(D-aspartate) O-methyltransferase